MSTTHDFSSLEEINGHLPDFHKVLPSLVGLGLKGLALDRETLLPYEWDAAATIEKAQEYQDRYPDLVPGIQTGEDIIAIEIPEEKADFFRDLCSAIKCDPDRTTEISSRTHITYLFSNPDHLDIPCETLQGIAIRGSGGYTIAAPARSADGTLWEICAGGLEPFPAKLIDILKKGASPKSDDTRTQKRSAPLCAIPEYTGMPRTFPIPLHEVFTRKDADEPESSLDLALNCAKHGIPVFACDENTSNPCSKKGEYNNENWSATTDPDLVAKYFKAHPNAMIGGVTGKETGFIVIDCDDKDERHGIASFYALCADHGFDPETTFSVRTPSGGLHFYFLHPPGVDIRNKRDYPRRGIDVRANGGFIFLPESRRGPKHEKHPGKSYIVCNGKQLGPLPLFLVNKLRKKEEPAPALASGSSAPEPNPLQGMEALGRGIQMILTSPVGSRNGTLNDVAYFCGLNIRDGHLQEPFVRKLLTEAALAAGLTEYETPKTINSGLTKGMASKEPIRKQCWGQTGRQRAGMPAGRRIIPTLPAPRGNAFVPGVITRYAMRDGMTDMTELVRRIFPPNMFNAIKSYSDIKGFPIEGIAPLAILMCATCIGGRRLVEVDLGEDVGGNQFLIILGDPLSGKSTAADHFIDPLRRKEAEYDRLYEMEKEKYRVKMAEWAAKKNRTDPKPKKPVRKQLTFDDATIEAAVRVHSENPHGLLWTADEGRGWFARLTRYNKDGATDVTTKFIQAHNCKSIVINRQPVNGEERDLKLTRSFLSIGVNLQPKLLPSMFSQEDRSQGLAQRFQYTYIPPKPRGKRYQGSRGERQNSQSDQRYLDELVGSLLSLGDGSNPKTLRIPDDVYRLIQEEGRKLELAIGYGTPEVYLGRLHKMVYRFALILHCLHWADSTESRRACPDTDITMEDAQRAIDLCRIYMIHLDRALWLMKEDRGQVKSLSPEQRQLVQLYLDDPEYFLEYRTVEQMEAKGLKLPEGKDRRLYGRWLKDQGFPSDRKKGYPGKYLLAGLEPWKDYAELYRLDLGAPEDPLASYIATLEENAEEIAASGGVIEPDKMADLMGSDPHSLEMDEDFWPAMERAGVTRGDDGRFRVPMDLLEMALASGPNQKTQEALQ